MAEKDQKKMKIPVNLSIISIALDVRSLQQLLNV